MLTSAHVRASASPTRNPANLRIPGESDHRFRRNPISDSGESDHPGVGGNERVGVR